MIKYALATLLMLAGVILLVAAFPTLDWCLALSGTILCNVSVFMFSILNSGECNYLNTGGHNE